MRSTNKIEKNEYLIKQRKTFVESSDEMNSIKIVMVKYKNQMISVNT